MKACLDTNEIPQTSLQVPSQITTFDPKHVASFAIVTEKVIKHSHIAAFNSDHKANFHHENATVTGFNSKHGAIP